MILLIDITNARSRAALVGARRAFWVEAPSRDALPALLEKLCGGRLRQSRKLPAAGASCVVALANAPGATRDVSWSGVRAAVAAANALAFAWGVPSVTAPTHGDESEADLEALARAAADRAKKGARASATYSGEPNITQSKPLNV